MNAATLVPSATEIDVEGSGISQRTHGVKLNGRCA